LETTPENIAHTNAGYWAILNKIKLQSGLFSFKDHEYQIDVMGERVKVTVDMKATQGGFTEIYVLKSLHGMIKEYYISGVLYLFPTNDDVNDFSKSRFKPLIQANKGSVGKYVKDTDTAALKKVKDAFLYLRGARLSQAVEGDLKESTKLRSIPVDCVVFDEYDLMEDDVEMKAEGRMGHSRVQEKHFLSNPTIPDYGIDAKFQQSDQRHWHRKCEHCREFTSAELEFPDCVKTKHDGTGYIGCRRCGRELSLFPGEWVAKYPDREIVGRRWSKLTSVFHDPADILERFINPPRGNLGDVYRLDLGLPYIAAEDRLRKADVFKCCGDFVAAGSHKGPCAMGVDVGKIKHIIIGGRTGANSFQLYRTARLSSWSDIHDLAMKYNVKSAVVDIRPYEDAAREFQKKEPYRVWLCEYSESTPIGWTYNPKTGIVKVNRTEIFDATHRMVTEQGTLVLPRISSEIEEFAKQLCATAKVLEINKKTKMSVYRYKKLGEEHYRNALNYFYLAATGGKIAVVNKYRKRKQTVANNEYVRI
jgi:hypothetical protein